jgi:8-oxo-dGTP pyrophosphatase MutT (NUDIX family)
MTSPKDPPKPAATVLIVRDAPQLEVLMVRRHAGMAFGADAWVFPGGKVAAPDADGAWDALSDGNFGHFERSLRIAAAREVFEESGLLLAVRGDGRAAGAEDCAALDGMRGAVEADPALFMTMLKDAGLRLTLDRLAPFAHWITPAFEPRRFDTHFFLVTAPENQIARHDGREAVDHSWVEPQAVLDKRRDGAARLMFPTRLNLEMLGRSANAGEAERAARARPVVTVEPVVEQRADGRVLLIPLEAGYGLSEERIENVMG